MKFIIFGLLVAFNLSDTRTIQEQTTLAFSELMSKYIAEETVVHDKDDHGHDSLTLGDVDKLILAQGQCNGSKDDECAKQLSSLLLHKVQLIVNKTRKSPSLYRELTSTRICFDGVNLEFYDPKTHVCCYGVLQESHGYEACCNKTIIDSRKYTCCNDVQYERSDTEACCGTDLYNTTTHMCCNGHMKLLFDGAECCDNDVYNTNTQLCCFDRDIFNKTQGDECCGDNVYSTLTHLCCETNVLPAFHREVQKTDKCCGNHSYHSECSRCEDREIIPLHEGKLCCDGTMYEPTYGMDSGCCLKKMMNLLTEECDVDGNIVFKNETKHLFWKSYNEVDDYDNSEQATQRPHMSVKQKKIHPGIIAIITISGTLGTASVSIMVYYCIIRPRRKGNHLSKCDRDEVNQKCISSVSTDHYKRECISLLPPSCNISTMTIDEPRHFKPQAYDDTDHYNRICIRSRPRWSISKMIMIDEPDLIKDQAYDDTDHYNRECITLSRPRWSIDKMIMIDEPDLIKDQAYGDMYLLNYNSEYSTSTSTQTATQKVTNRRNILGKAFDYTEHLSLNKSTIQMPNSEVKMTLPQSVLIKHGSVEVNASTFRSIRELQSKLDIPADEKLASPTVEYVLTGHTELPDYAVVVMPFTGDARDLKVRKFRSDDGLRDKADALHVPEQGKANEELEMYYIVKGYHVYIYTKSFSGFYCTTCKHTRSMKLHAYVYGSFKKMDVMTGPVQYKVSITMYIADDILKFVDYKERMNDNMDRQGQVMLKDQLIKLPEQLKEDDVLTATYKCANESIWQPMCIPNTDIRIKELTQDIRLAEIAEKCPNCPMCHLTQSEIPNQLEWHLTSKPNMHPSYEFTGFIDISTTSDSKRGPPTTDMIYFENLKLRYEDRYSTEENNPDRCISGIKDYLTNTILPSGRREFLNKLRSDTGAIGQTVEEVFAVLQEKYTFKGLLEAVVKAMKATKQFNAIDDLAAKGYIPTTYVHTHVQPVTVDVPPSITSLGFEPQNESLQGTGTVAGRAVDVTEKLEQPRPELSHPNNNSDSLEDSTLKNNNCSVSPMSSNECALSEAGLVRSEMESNTQDLSSGHVVHPNNESHPVQENASLDETYPKEGREQP